MHHLHTGNARPQQLKPSPLSTCTQEGKTAAWIPCNCPRQVPRSCYSDLHFHSANMCHEAQASKSANNPRSCFICRLWLPYKTNPLEPPLPTQSPGGRGGGGDKRHSCKRKEPLCTDNDMQHARCTDSSSTRVIINHRPQNLTSACACTGLPTSLDSAHSC